MPPPGFAHRNKARLKIFVRDPCREPAASGGAEPALQPLAQTPAEGIVGGMAVADLQNADRTMPSVLLERRQRQEEWPQLFRSDEPFRVGGVAGRDRRAGEDQQKQRGAGGDRSPAAAHRVFAAEVDKRPTIFSAISSYPAAVKWMPSSARSRWVTPSRSLP